MITLTPCPAGATPLRPGTAHIAISHARSPRPGWQDQGIPAPHVNAGAAEQGQPGDVLPEDRSAARHLLRAPDRGGPGNACTGDTTGYVGYKTFDQMAGELKA